MQNLVVTIIQTNLFWNDINANLANIEEKIWTIGSKTDLIILPEMFTTGFSMDVVQVAEPMNFTTFKWMKQMASQTHAVIMGSYIVKENGQFFNRLIAMYPDGNYVKYDKRHLFRIAEEHNVFQRGIEKVIIDLKGWKIAPFICYDLRFPVWSRNNSNNMYDILVYVANWPASRALHWETLLRARAIENLSYSIGVNRVGEDGKGISYSGDSSIFSPKGETLFSITKEEGIYSHLFNYNDLESYRNVFPAYLDSDDFSINI